jgi:hypothetical protein
LLEIFTKYSNPKRRKKAEMDGIRVDITSFLLAANAMLQNVTRGKKTTSDSPINVTAISDTSGNITNMIQV